MNVSCLETSQRVDGRMVKTNLELRDERLQTTVRQVIWAGSRELDGYFMCGVLVGKKV